MTESVPFTTDNSSSLQPSSNDTKAAKALLFFLKDAFFISGICVAFLSFIATVANGLLLLAIWKDPHKRFRTPSTVFVLGLTLADLLTGILVGPIISYTRIAFITPASANNSQYHKVGQMLSMVTMNSSFIILLFLTWNQFAAIRFPHEHRRLVTARKVKSCVVLAWVYSLLFASMLLWVQEDVVYQIDFYAHNCTFIVFLTIAYVCLCTAFRRQTSRIVATTSTSDRLSIGQYQNKSSRRRRNTEKQFTIVAMMLVMFIIACTLPATVIHIVYAYTKDNIMSKSSEKILLIAREISSVVLFLKFSLDPFLYCWRLSSYRRALGTIVRCGRSSRLAEFSASISARSRSVRHRETRPCDSVACENNSAL